MSSLLRTWKRRIDGVGGGMGSRGGGKVDLEEEKRFSSTQTGMLAKASKPPDLRSNHPRKSCKKSTWKGRRSVCYALTVTLNPMEVE